MCGIAAYSGLTTCNMDHMRTLMLSNLPRGLDATGVYSPKNNLLKEPVNAVNFLNKHKNLRPDTHFIAHLRAKTFGENTAANAHPYEFDSMVGVHNGTLILPWQLCAKHGFDISTLHVDSQVLYSILDKQYTESGYDISELKILSEFEGAAALVWYDKIDGSMMVYRNKERPLHYGYVNKNQLYMASLPESLELIGARNITLFPENVLHNIHKGKITRTVFYPPYVKPVAPIVRYGGTVAHNQLRPEEYIGYYWMARSTNVHTGVTEHKGYLCIGVATDPQFPASHNKDLVIINDHNVHSTVNRWSFGPECYEHMQVRDNFVMALSDLYTGEEKVVDQGQILQLNSPYALRNAEGMVNFSVKNLKNNKFLTVSSNFLYPIDHVAFFETLKNADYYNNPALKLQYGEEEATDEDVPVDAEFTVIEAAEDDSLTLERADLVALEEKYYEDRSVENKNKVVTYKEVYHYLEEIEVQLNFASGELISSLQDRFNLCGAEVLEMSMLIDESLLEVTNMVNTAMVEEKETIGSLEYGQITF